MPVQATAIDNYKFFSGLFGICIGAVVGIGWLRFTYKLSENNPDQLMAGALVAISSPIVAGLAFSSLAGKMYKFLH